MDKTNEAVTSEQELDDEIDLLKLAHHVLQKWYLLVLGLLIGGCLGAAYNLFMVTPMYSSSALICMRSGTTSLSIGDLNLSTDLNEDYIVMFKTRSILADVIDELDLNMKTDDLDSLVSVSSVNDTRILQITANNADPFVAKDIANTLAEKAVDMVKEVDAQSPYIIEKAVASSSPYTDSIYKSAIKFALVGFVLVGVIIVAYALINDVVEGTEDIEQYLHLPVLAAIPEDKSLNYHKRASKKKRKEK